MQEIVINETYKEPETRRAKRSAVKILPTDEEQLGINNHSGTQKVRKSIEKEKKNVEKTTTTTEKSTFIPVKKTETTKEVKKEKVIQDEKTSTGTTTSTEASTKKDENTTKQKDLGKEIIIPSESKNTTEEHEDESKNLLIEYANEEPNDNITEPISDEHDWNTIAHDLVKSRHISVRHDACLKITSRDMIGLGHEFTSHQLRELRTPIIFVYSSIILCILSCLYVFTKYTAPGQFSTLMINLLHVLLWAVICVVLFQLRTNWPSHWINSSIQPEYPAYWIAAEVMCFLVLFGCLLETYFADLLHYNLYLEQSAGVYEIIEPPRQYRCGAYERSFSVDFVEAETQEVKTMTL